MSQLESIGNSDGSKIYSAYSYLGADKIVTEDYQVPNVKLDYTGSNELSDFAGVLG